MEDDWTDPEIWAKANPSLGVTIQHEEIARACDEAKATPRLENVFKRYRLNMWVEQANRWIPMDKWDACAGEPEIPEGATVCGALDLASKLDLTAFCVAYKGEAEREADTAEAGDGGVYHVKWWFWLPEQRVREVRNNPNRELYEQWAKEGWIELTPGDVVDYEFVRRRVREVGQAV